MNEEPTTTRADHGLSHSLSRRHLSMIAIGGVIGAGLFVGSGQAIRSAGPGVLIAYTLTGLLVVLVMRMLGEMSTADPQSGSFSVYAERTYGRWAGFTVGWLYWWFWVVVIGVEATAGASIVHRWVPVVPQWGWVLIMMVALTVTNLFSVRFYGEFEFWFAAVKVVAIVAFLLVGVAAIAGVLPGVPAPGLSNLTGHGGFLPGGISPVFSAMFVVVFSYFGAEIASIAAAETSDPVRMVRTAVRSVLSRILVFYLGSIAIVVTLLPYDDASVSKSPYVAVLDRIGLPAAATALDVIVLTAVLSCLNSGLYTASRMALSLSNRGEAPSSWGAISASGVPRVAVLASTALGFLTVALNYVVPEAVFTFLLNTSAAIALVVWLAIALSHLRMRRRLEREAPDRLVLRMWGFPYLTYAAVAFIVLLVVGMLVDEAGRSQAAASLVLTAGVVVVGVVRQRRRGASPDTKG